MHASQPAVQLERLALAMLDCAKSTRVKTGTLDNNTFITQPESYTVGVTFSVQAVACFVSASAQRWSGKSICGSVNFLLHCARMMLLRTPASVGVVRTLRHCAWGGGRYQGRGRGVGEQATCMNA